MWSKLGAFKPGKLETGKEPPSQSIESIWQQHTKADRIIQIVNSHELRVGKSEIIDRSIKRDCDGERIESK